MSKDKTLEENLKDIEHIIETMENGDITLEASIKLYKEGVTLLEQCNSKMDTIEKELIIIKENNKA